MRRYSYLVSVASVLLLCSCRPSRPVLSSKPQLPVTKHALWRAPQQTRLEDIEILERADAQTSIFVVHAKGYWELAYDGTGTQLVDTIVFQSPFVRPRAVSVGREFVGVISAGGSFSDIRFYDTKTSLERIVITGSGSFPPNAAASDLDGDGTVEFYVGGGNQIYSIDSEGRTRWATTLATGLSVTDVQVDVTRGLVVVLATDSTPNSHLYSFDPSGQRRGITTAPGYASSFALVGSRNEAPDSVVLGYTTGVRAIDVSGKFLWQHMLPEGISCANVRAQRAKTDLERSVDAILITPRTSQRQGYLAIIDGSGTCLYEEIIDRSSLFGEDIERGSRSDMMFVLSPQQGALTRYTLGRNGTVGGPTK